MNNIHELLRYGNDVEHPRQQQQMGGDDQPAPPDYTGAAKETAAGNEQAARVASEANRVNQYGPGGSIEYSRRPGTFDEAGYSAALQAARASGGAAPDINLFGNPNQWNVTTSLSPTQQQLYNLKGQTDLKLGNLALTGTEKAQGLLSNPNVDLSGLPGYQYSVDGSDAARQQAQDSAYSRATRYLDPQMARSQEALRTQLLNQGIGMGNEAYKGAMSDFEANKANVYGDARDRAIASGNQEFQQSFGRGLQSANLVNANRAQQIGERAYLQDRPLNLINALRSGTQVQGPQFQNVPQQATTQGADLLTAAGNKGAANTNIYNAQVGQQNALTSGLFDLGSSFFSR